MVKSKLFAPVRFGLLGAACVILVLQASTTSMLKIDERKIPIPGLHQLPLQFEKWKSSQEATMPATTEQYLKPDEYILRDYMDQQGGPMINVFVAYFKSLQSKYGPHSPSVCLPGSGWKVTSSKISNIVAPGRPQGFPVNEYTMEKSDQRLLVLYWYQNDRYTWANEYEAKFRLIPDLLKYHRSDVSLVRVIVPITSSTGQIERADSLQFTKYLYPFLAARFQAVH